MLLYYYWFVSNYSAFVNWNSFFMTGNKLNFHFYHSCTRSVAFSVIVYQKLNLYPNFCKNIHFGTLKFKLVTDPVENMTVLPWQEVKCGQTLMIFSASQQPVHVCVLFVWFLLFVVVLSGDPKQNQGRGLVDRKLVQAPSNFIAGRPKAALLFWFSWWF